jgi:hypothetical protein
LPSRSVPTQNDILVPETLLKKRKSQEKAREDRAAATKEKRGTHHADVHVADPGRVI